MAIIQYVYNKLVNLTRLKHIKMDNSIANISLINLGFAAIPALWVIWVLFKWSLDGKNALYSIARMLTQLLLVGYVLSYIFATDSAWVVIGVLSVMVFASSWIAMGVVKVHRRALYRHALLAIATGGVIMFVVIMLVVLEVDAWYTPHIAIPIAGMIFANSMNSVSLAAERLSVELSRGEQYLQAKTTALQTAMIPVINSLFAVGLVSLPGMMTGQILSGVSPLIAARYQIMVMLMIFAASGISSILFLISAQRVFQPRE